MFSARLPLLRRIVLHLVAWTLVGLVPCQAIALSVAHARGPGHVHRPAAESGVSTVTELCVALDDDLGVGDRSPGHGPGQDATAWCVPSVAASVPVRGSADACTLRPRLPWTPTPSFETRDERPPRPAAG